jgi:ParB/RepB/Spo0J family partition protein
MDGVGQKPEGLPQLGYLPLDKIIPNDWNPQEQDESTFNRLVEEIQEVGFIDPLEVVPLDDGNYRILGGEHRWKAAKQAGLTEVPVSILTDVKWQSEDLQKLVTVRLNVMRGELNPEKFLKLYNEMVRKYGKDPIQNLMGYTSSEKFQKLVGASMKALKKALPKEMHGAVDAAGKEAKSVEDIAKIVQEMFAQYGDTVNSSFMVFTHGKQQHIYIAMNKKMRHAMDKVVAYCKLTKEDINDVMVPITEAYMLALEDKLAQVYEDKPNGKPPAEEAADGTSGGNEAEA